jgi:hypothetical protein
MKRLELAQGICQNTVIDEAIRHRLRWISDYSSVRSPIASSIMRRQRPPARSMRTKTD